MLDMPVKQVGKETVAKRWWEILKFTSIAVVSSVAWAAL